MHRIFPFRIAGTISQELFNARHVRLLRDETCFRCAAGTVILRKRATWNVRSHAVYDPQKGGAFGTDTTLLGTIVPNDLKLAMGKNWRVRRSSTSGTVNQKGSETTRPQDCVTRHLFE